MTLVLMMSNFALPSEQFVSKQALAFKRETIEEAKNINLQSCFTILKDRSQNDNFSIRSFIKSLEGNYLESFEFPCSLNLAENQNTMNRLSELQEDFPSGRDTSCRRVIFSARLYFGHSCIWK